MFPGGKGGRCLELTTLPPSCADCLEIWGLNLLEPSGPVQACNGIALPFTTPTAKTECHLSLASSTPPISNNPLNTEIIVFAEIRIYRNPIGPIKLF